MGSLPSRRWLEVLLKNSVVLLKKEKRLRATVCGIHGCEVNTVWKTDEADNESIDQHSAFNADGEQRDSANELVCVKEMKKGNIGGLQLYGRKL